MMFEKIKKGKDFLDQTEAKIQRFEERVRGYITNLTR